MASNLQSLISQSSGVALYDEEFSFGNVIEAYHVSTINDHSIEDKNAPEQINSKFCQPIDAENSVTGSIIEADEIMYVQKCLHGEYYYAPYDIY